MSLIDREVTAHAAENVWKNLRYLRNTFRLTDTEIGKATGIGRTTVTNKLEGRTALIFEEVLKLATLFGVPLEVLQMDRQPAMDWISTHWDDVTEALTIADLRKASSGWIPTPGALAGAAA